MSYDLKAFCRDLQDRLNWLFKEVVRLQEENERLLQQNKELREEATLSRLIREMEPEENETFAEQEPELPSSLPEEALDFYRRLPASFNFADYFHAADAHGLSAAVARDWMVIFFRENMLEQRGRIIEKKENRPSYSVRLVR